MGGNTSLIGKPEKGFGYRVLQVEQNSVAFDAGIFDKSNKGFQYF